tara:strand:+ start:4156 stop:4716 length:561 start_codon:yes stop_codon:yes gene_type:complete
MDHCNYLDANKQNSSEMLFNCIPKANLGKDMGCQSQYKLYDNIAINSENIAIKRGINAGYGINPYQQKEKIKSYDSFEKNYATTTEGFINYDPNQFLIHNGPGESTVSKQCPEGFRWCEKSHKCIQVCINCKYNDNMKSQSFNEADPCFPEGVYNGINNDNLTQCTCGTKNQYCSEQFLNQFRLFN